jgi:precorrin-6B C5,15-methyltransferase / cobalt-precorrin-6B C5,C15-methyltransferase
VTAWLTIVGMAEGSVGPAALAALDGAHTVLGPERLLARLGTGKVTPLPTSPARGEVDMGHGLAVSDTLPLAGRDGEGVLAGHPSRPSLIPWQPPLATMLDQVTALRGTPTAILATGDPMWFGIGATLARHLEPGEFEVVPAVSALQLAAARLKWPLQHVVALSLHGRPVETLHPRILPGNRIIALTTDGGTVTAVAALLVARGYGRSRLAILENLGGGGERTTIVRAAEFQPGSVGDFHVLAIECEADPAAPLLPPVPGLPDEAFVSDGQLTKRDVRAASLAKLAPYPGARLWDVGAGCGSVAVEWLRAARDTRAIAFERDPSRCAIIAANAQALGTPGLDIVSGDAPASLAGQPAPDAVFLGGDVGNAGLFDACWQALRPGGRLVANAVTLDGETALYERHDRHGGDLTRIEVAVLDRVGGHRVMRPRMAVTQWLVVKP